MHSKINTLTFRNWKLSKKVTIVCGLLAIFAVSGTIYGITALNTKVSLADQTVNAGQTQSGLSEIKNPSPTPSVNELAPEEETASESIPASNTPVAQSGTANTTHNNTPEVYRPASLQATEVRAAGGELCDSPTYKLGLSQALIFTNGRPGLVEWRIEGLRNGVIETVATGSLQIAENRHTNELPLNYSYYMTQPISTETGIRFRVISPNDIASSWIYPSEVLSSESPCAWPNGS